MHFMCHHVTYIVVLGVAAFTFFRYDYMLQIMQHGGKEIHNAMNIKCKNKEKNILYLSKFGMIFNSIFNVLIFAMYPLKLPNFCNLANFILNFSYCS